MEQAFAAAFKAHPDTIIDQFDPYRGVWRARWRVPVGVRGCDKWTEDMGSDLVALLWRVAADSRGAAVPANNSPV